MPHISAGVTPRDRDAALRAAPQDEVVRDEHDPRYPLRNVELGVNRTLHSVYIWRMAFPPGFLDELRARISLSDVVGRKVSLKRRSGSEYAGLCPFHNEKTPSFTIDDFRLGFAPDTRDGLLAALKREGVPIDKIVEAGLVIQPEDNREAYDRFRGRVMFPISDRRGRVIAFGGRVMGAGEPKYLNSPETPLFHKGANLYCLDRARVAATQDQPVIVAEGYMDVIALHGAGFVGAVAPLGTALTEGQLGELWKLADEPYLCFDGDNAGRRAAARAAERALPLLRAGKSLRFLVLPAGEDPDSLIRVRGADAIRRILDLARPLSDVVWDMETEGKVADTPERRASLQRAVEQRVAEIADPVVRDYYRTDMRDRFARLRRAAAPPWQPGGRRPFRGPGPEPAPFAAGAAARRAGADLEGSRQEREIGEHT